MASRQQCQAIREGRAAHTSPEQPDTRSPTFLFAQCKRAPRRDLREAAGTIPRMIRERVFLEIFSGCGRLCKAMSDRGYRVLPWDITQGPAFELLFLRNRQLIKGWIASQAIVCFHLGTPCSSWSRARDRPGGPPPLRSDSSLWGFPDLRPGDRERVRQGNLFAHFTSALLLLAHRMHVPATLENPMMSRLWLVPGIRRASERGSGVVIDMCQYGTRWLKPTRLLGVACDVEQLERRCTFRMHGSCKGLCSRTGKTHQKLNGEASPGVFWTRLAQSYPNKCCEALTLCLDEGVRFRFGEEIPDFNGLKAIATRTLVVGV